MDTIIQKFMIIAVVVGGTAILLVWGWRASMNSKDNAEKALSKGDEIYAEIDNEEFNRYQDSDVSGSEVINLIKRYDGSSTGIIVTIGTGATSTSTCYCKGLTVASGVASYSDSATLGSLTDAKDVTKTTKYINPTKKFTGEVLKDAAGNIVGLHFTLKTS